MKIPIWANHFTRCTSIGEEAITLLSILNVSQNWNPSFSLKVSGTETSFHILSQASEVLFQFKTL